MMGCNAMMGVCKLHDYTLQGNHDTLRLEGKSSGDHKTGSFWKVSKLMTFLKKF